MVAVLPALADMHAPEVCPKQCQGIAGICIAPSPAVLPEKAFQGAQPEGSGMKSSSVLEESVEQFRECFSVTFKTNHLLLPSLSRCQIVSFGTLTQLYVDKIPPDSMSCNEEFGGIIWKYLFGQLWK